MLLGVYQNSYHSFCRKTTDFKLIFEPVIAHHIPIRQCPYSSGQSPENSDIHTPIGRQRSFASAGGTLWRLKFRVIGKEKLLSFGGWPEVSLANARKERDKAREALASGSDPSREKQQAKLRAKVAAANSCLRLSPFYGIELSKYRTIEAGRMECCYWPELSALGWANMALPSAARAGQAAAVEISCCNVRK